MDGNDAVADFVTGLVWAEVPPPARLRARLCLLDGLGAVLGGSLAPVSRLAARYAATNWGGDEATILLHGRRASAAGAAFANAASGNALDVDDDAIFTRGHPGAQLIPTVLAVGESVGSSGQAILEALVVGYEVAIRAGHCWHHYHQEYQACASWGSVACAAASARLLGLDHDQVKHALGIAEYFAPNVPMMRDVAAPSMAKHGICWGAMTGVQVAQLAQQGFTGVPSLLGFPRYGDWVTDIGQVYLMSDGVMYKEWCSCAWGHAACVAAQGLQRAHQISPESIQHIRVRAFQAALDLYRDLPSTTEQAQFSLKWPLACLLLDGEIGPRQVTGARLDDPKTRALFDRIEVTLDPEIETLYQGAVETDLRMYRAVEITLCDGTQFASGIIERQADRYDQPALERKFRWLVGHVLDSDRVEDLIAAVDHFERLADIRSLRRLLG